MGETEYARSGDLHIAYQTFGQGDLDVVLVADWFSNVELMWEGPPLAHALERLGRFARLTVFDKRGSGLSDPVPAQGLPALEQWIDDVGAVMDQAGIDQAALIGMGAGGPMVMQFAATHPERTAALVLVNTYARLAWAPDYPAGVPDAVRERVLDHPYSASSTAAVLSGSLDDPEVRSWWTRYQRHSVSPGPAEAMRRMMFEVDVRAVLGSIHVPTLVLHRQGDPWIRIGHGRYLAETIPGARLVELPGDEDLFFLGDTDLLLDEVEEFLTGVRPASRSDRVLATLLFTDIVGSTSTASELGDRRWRQLLDRHDTVVDRCLRRGRGRKVNPTGDGMLALFDGPGRAISTARAIRHELDTVGLDVRAGIHTGEVEVRGSDVGGIAVHLGARIAACAEAGQILVSSTVRDLVVGSDLTFADAGHRELKGLPGQWQLLSVAGT